MKVIYEDENAVVYDKPPGINSDDFEMRVHRLDKDTSGVFLIAKNADSLAFLQQQFKARNAYKKYLALISGHADPQEGEVNTLIGRSPQDRRKQKVYFQGDPDSESKREAVTKYKVLQKFADYDLIEAEPRTGRKHQIRAHMAYLGHPIAGDKLYSFKGQPCPKSLKRQFLHAAELTITMPDGKKKTFQSDLPKDLRETLDQLK